MSASFEGLSKNRSPPVLTPSKIPKLLSTEQRTQSANNTPLGPSSTCNDKISTALVKVPRCYESTEAEVSCTSQSNARYNSRQQISHHPHYIAEHVGDPCTLGALDHLLQCGHKIVTEGAEICASNCQPCTSAFANPKGIDLPFVCMACITQQLNTAHNDKFRSFLEDLNVVARTTGKRDAAAWVSRKTSIVDEAWRESEVHQMTKRISEGRFCYAVYVEEEYQGAYSALLLQMEQYHVRQAHEQLLVGPTVDDRMDRRHMSSKIPKKSLSRCITLM